jgi:putative Mn2+ efflux pump MntP
MMDFPSLFVIALSLSADCFAVALSSGISRHKLSYLRLLRLPLFFGVFQALMTVLGWLVGRSIFDFISDYDHWVAFGLLSAIGIHMIWESFRERDEAKAKRNFDSWYILILLAIATSIDSLAVGLSLAFLEVNITLAAVTIGLTSLVITLIGVLLGKKVGALVGERAETVGGVILIIIGVRILLEHIL